MKKLILFIGFLVNHMSYCSQDSQGSFKSSANSGEYKDVPLNDTNEKSLNKTALQKPVLPSKATKIKRQNHCAHCILCICQPFHRCVARWRK